MRGSVRKAPPASSELACRRTWSTESSRVAIRPHDFQPPVDHAGADLALLAAERIGFSVKPPGTPANDVFRPLRENGPAACVMSTSDLRKRQLEHSRDHTRRATIVNSGWRKPCRASFSSCSVPVSTPSKAS